jgi:hypothetical protein
LRDARRFDYLFRLLQKQSHGETKMKKIAFVLAALAAIAFAMPVTSADAKGMKHHHHHHHHHMKKM